MWVRAVAAALAVWCASGAAMAAGYTEMWNPPEASGHAGAKKHATVGKVGHKADAKHAAGVSHKATKVVAGAGHGDKPVAHGGVKKVAVKGAKGDRKQLSAAANKGKPKTAVLAQAKKPHTPSAHTKAGQHVIARADAGHPAHPHAVHVAAKSGPATAVASHPNATTPVASANFGGGAADASTNPATASSGSLPPIIH
jgi:hypothetical protein